MSIVELAEVVSTNDWLLARPGLADSSWVVAAIQTGGRGRRGRTWVSQPGNMFASVTTTLQPGEGPPQQLSFVAAVALARALDVWVTPARLTLKWPNDLLLDGVKLSGILLERHGDGTVIGFGVNLVDHPIDTDRPALSLQAAGIVPPSPPALCAALADSFADVRKLWREAGFAPVREAWLARASGLGRPIEARLGNGTVAGRFETLDTDGALLLRLDDGGLRAIHAGEVFARG